jgi:putative transposase
VPQAGRPRAKLRRWKKQFAGDGIGDIRRLKQLEDENANLKRLVADLKLDKMLLQDAIVRPFVKHPVVDHFKAV